MSQAPQECQSCHKELKPGDDTVVCPSCGAPYHRECYQREGHCVYQERHAQGFEWKPKETPPPAPTAQGSPGGQGGIVCKNCGTINDRMHIFCENCGAPLHEAENEGSASGSQGAFPTAGPLTFEQAYGRQQATDMAGEIDGIPKRDWALFIGSSAPAYLPRLSLQSRQGSKVGFMFSPFFLGTFYFAYRKMWSWAAIALVSFLLLSAPGMLWTLGEAGMPLFPALPQATLASIANLCTILSFARQVVFGLFALYFFRLDAGQKIRAVKGSLAEGGDYTVPLQKKGGASMLGPVVLLVLFFAFSFWLYAYGGDALMNFLLSQYYNIG